MISNYYFCGLNFNLFLFTYFFIEVYWNHYFELSFSPFNSASFCFMYPKMHGFQLLGLSMFIIVISFWRTNTFFIIKCPSLFLVLIFVLKFISSDTSIAIPTLITVYLVYLLSSFHLFLLLVFFMVVPGNTINTLI